MQHTRSSRLAAIRRVAGAAGRRSRDMADFRQGDGLEDALQGGGPDLSGGGRNDDAEGCRTGIDAQDVGCTGHGGTSSKNRL